MTLTLNSLEITILLNCNEKMLSKSKLCQMSRSYSNAAKEKAIKSLKDQSLILIQELPKLGSKKIPVFYKITEKGKKWVDEYIKNYPR